MAFKENEAALLGQIANEQDKNKQDGLLEKLGFLYIYQMNAPDKILTLLPQIQNPLISYTLRLHAINANNQLNKDQKIEAYKNLLALFPEQASLLNYMIKNTKS